MELEIFLGRNLVFRGFYRSRAIRVLRGEISFRFSFGFITFLGYFWVVWIILFFMGFLGWCMGKLW
jgi:hypothetical protein